MADLNVEIAASLGRFEREMAKVESRLTKLANNVEKKAGAQLSKVDTSSARTAANLNKMVGEMGRVDHGARRFGGSLQQVGFQVGDFATQVGAGTSAAQALGQQLPQLLGAFGTFGALAGAAAAIMIPLGSALIKTAFDSETLDDRMKGLEKSTDAMTEAAKLAAIPISELRAKHGDLAETILQSSQAMAAFTAAQAGAQLRGAAGATAALFPDAAMQTRLFSMSDAEWAEVNEAQMRKLMKATGATREQADELAMALRRLESANGPEAVARDAGNLLNVMSKLPDATSNLAAQFSAIQQLMAQAQAQVEAQRLSITRLRDEYDKTTAKLEQLSDDLAAAEAERAKSAAANKADEVKQWDRVIAKIREMAYETRAAAQESDTLFERMTKGAQGFLGRAGDFIDGATGRMAGSSALTIGKQYAGMGEKPNREELKALVGVDPATVAWCAAFMNAVLDKAGSKGTGSLAARSFLDWGTAVDKPSYGDVVVLKRGNNSSQGHVGFYEGENPDGTIRVFGGNQGNRVGTDNYRRENVLGYRRAPAPGRYVNPQAAIEEDRITRDSVAAQAAEKATAESLKRETAERKRRADAIKEYGQQLAANLLTEQQTAALEKQRADQIAAINSGTGTDAEKAAAIAAVNAAMEKQITIMALTEEAKRRQVDLDTQMVGSTMTYRQAIEALGDAASQKVIADQAMQASAQSLAEAQAFASQQMQSLQDGFIDAIIAGESFSDVLKNVAANMAKAWAQAALFGNGPLGSQGGGGLLSGLFQKGGFLSQVFGGFRADGGPISGGRAYVVGERGPEIIVPRSAGNVIPNHALGRSGGGMSVTIDLRGTTGDKALDEKLRAGAARTLAQAERMAPGWIANNNKRTG